MVHWNLTVSQVPLTAGLANQNALISWIAVSRDLPPTGDVDDDDGYDDESEDDPWGPNWPEHPSSNRGDESRNAESPSNDSLRQLNKRESVVKITRGYLTLSIDLVTVDKVEAVTQLFWNRVAATA